MTPSKPIRRFRVRKATCKWFVYSKGTHDRDWKFINHCHNHAEALSLAIKYADLYRSFFAKK